VRHEENGELAAMDAARHAAGDREPLMTVEEAWKFTKCHEESIRRAYRARQLRIVPFGARGVRIRRRDLEDWIASGMKTTRR
jgi:excisionase family DNA binding protein